MADPFPVSGNIDPTTFPRLLVDLHRQGATGSLKINGPNHLKALYFRGGRILFGSSNDSRDHLGAILIESGKITREQLDEVNAKVGPGNPLAKILAESGFVNQRELGDAARDKVERILSDVLSWESGSFEFEDGVLPKGAVDLKLSTGRLLLAGVRRIGDRAFALRHLGGDMKAVLEPASEAGESLSDIRAEVWPLLERLDGQRTLQDAVALTRFDEFEAAKIACAMLFLGVVRRHAGGGGEVDLAHAAETGLGDGPAAGGFPSPVAPDAEPLGAVPLPDAAAPVEVSPLVIPEPEPFSAEPPAPRSAATPGFQLSVPTPAEGTPFAVSTGFPFVEADEPIPDVSPEMEPPVTPRPPEPPPAAPMALHAEPPMAPGNPDETAPGGLPAEPPRVTSTLPGERPVFSAPVPPREQAPGVDIPAPPPVSPKPTKEDLAALDALLNPAEADGTASRALPRAEKWEPQFRPGTSPPERRAVGRRGGGGSRNNLYAALGGLAIVLIGGAAAGYMILGRSPATPGDPSAPSASPANAPTPATPPSTTRTVASDPTSEPTPLADPTPPATTPPPTRVPAASAPLAGDALALLRQGDLDGSARQSAASLGMNPAGRYAIQALVACSPETVHKAAEAVADDQLFILPVNYRGRACHRICWGVFDDRASAEAAIASFPDYFRQNGISARIQPVVDLLP